MKFTNTWLYIGVPLASPWKPIAGVSEERSPGHLSPWLNIDRNIPLLQVFLDFYGLSCNVSFFSKLTVDNSSAQCLSDLIIRNLEKDKIAADGVSPLGLSPVEF